MGPFAGTDPETYARPIEMGGECVAPGETKDIELELGVRTSGRSLSVPVRVIRSSEPGPRVFVTAAIHGDEMNGIGVVQQLLSDPDLTLKAGTLILVPVVNLMAFEQRSRYLPDRRDLNRFFPGKPQGSVASRMAHRIFEALVKNADAGIDLHSASVHRTNFPSIRGDLSKSIVAELAWSTGCELLVQARGPAGSFGREATRAGCPTLVLEAGEALKIEPTVAESGVRYVSNMLVALGLLDRPIVRPSVQVRIERTRWIRAQHGGFLEFHALPGELVSAEQPLATHTDLMRRKLAVIRAPADGIVLGVTTLPAVTPGEPVCHLALPKTPLSAVRGTLEGLSARSLHTRLRTDLATNIRWSEPPRGES